MMHASVSHSWAVLYRFVRKPLYHNLIQVQVYYRSAEQHSMTKLLMLSFL